MSDITEHLSTLRRLLQQHPEWADLPMAIYRPDGTLDYVGAAGAVDEGIGYEGERVLVFFPN